MKDKILQELYKLGISYNDIRRFDYRMKSVKTSVERAVELHFRAYGSKMALAPISRETLLARMKDTGESLSEILATYALEEQFLKGDIRAVEKQRYDMMDRVAETMNDLIGYKFFNRESFEGRDTEEIQYILNTFTGVNLTTKSEIHAILTEFGVVDEFIQEGWNLAEAINKRISNNIKR